VIDFTGGHQAEQRPRGLRRGGLAPSAQRLVVVGAQVLAPAAVGVLLRREPVDGATNVWRALVLAAAILAVPYGTAASAQTTLKMNSWIARESETMDRYDPDKKVALFVDEWGDWWAPNPGSNPGFLQQQNTMLDAIVASLNLNIFMRHADRVRGANIAQMINVLQAMILTDKEKMVLTPTYYVYEMYVPFQDATFVPVTFDAGTYTHDGITLPRVDAIAAKDKAGKLWLAITNVDPNQSAELEVSLAGINAKSAAGETLTAPKVDSVNTFESPATVAPRPFVESSSGGKVILKLLPHSITVVAEEMERVRAEIDELRTAVTRAEKSGKSMGASSSRSPLNATAVSMAFFS
jgi:hypothetical protein